MKTTPLLLIIFLLISNVAFTQNTILNWDVLFKDKQVIEKNYLADHKNNNGLNLTFESKSFPTITAIFLDTTKLEYPTDTVLVVEEIAKESITNLLVHELIELTKNGIILEGDQELDFNIRFILGDEQEFQIKYLFQTDEQAGNDTNVQETDEESFDETISFIPELYDTEQGSWPNFISKNDQNIKYRFAIDFSESFAQASVWKLKNERGNEEYKKKRIIRPIHPRFISMSVKNYYPKYDSIATTSSFSSYNLEGRANFEKFQKSALPDIDANSAKDNTSEDIASPSSTNEEKKKAFLLNKLSSDLSNYSSYLTRNILEKSIWMNDLQYINNRIKSVFGLTDFSTSGMRKMLMEYASDLEMDKKEELIDRTVLSYAHILTYSIFSTAPIQIEDKDVLIYTLDFYKDGKKVETANYKFLVFGGFKIDYSTGMAYSGLADRQYHIVNAGTRVDTTFYVDPNFNTTDSITALTTVKMKKVELLKEDINIGVTALMHFYTRMGAKVNWGGSLGFMLNTQAEFNILAGGSILLGQQQRLVLTGGAAFGQVNRLNPKYEIGTSYTETELGQVNDAQLAIKKWDISYFIGISYNLGSIK